MKRTLFTLALGLAGPFAAAQVPQDDLCAVLPADTLGVLSIRDLGRVFTLDEDGGLRALLRHPAVKRAFDQVYQSFAWLQDKDVMLALDLEPEEIVRMLNGRLTVALPELVLEQKQIERGDGTLSVELDINPTGGFSLLADLEATPDKLHEVLENIAALWREEQDVNRVQLLSDEFEGMRVYWFEVEELDGDVKEPFRLALKDGLLVASDRKETVEDLLDRLANGPPEGDRLVDDPAYLETLERLGPTDAMLYINVEELGPMVNQVIAHEIRKGGTDVEQYVRGDDLVAALGLDAFWSCFAGLRVEDDEASLVFGFTHEERERGLAALMTYADRGVEIPEWFHPDLHSASVTSFDFSALYHKVMDMVRKASPFAHVFLTTQLSQLEAGGYPIRDALLENLDGMLIEVLGYPDGFTPGPDDHPTQAYVVRVKDPQSLAEAAAELGETQGEEEPVEFMNETIYTVPLPIPFAFGGASAGLSFAVVENYLIAAIGDRRMVETIIAHMRNPGASVLDDQALQAALDDLPGENVVGIGWMDLADVLANAIRGTRTGLEFQVATADDDDDVDRAVLERAIQVTRDLPDMSDLNWFLAAKTYRTPESFVQRMLLRRRG